MGGQARYLLLFLSPAPFDPYAPCTLSAALALHVRRCSLFPQCGRAERGSRGRPGAPGPAVGPSFPSSAGRMLSPRRRARRGVARLALRLGGSSGRTGATSQRVRVPGAEPGAPSPGSCPVPSWTEAGNSWGRDRRRFSFWSLFPGVPLLPFLRGFYPPPLLQVCFSFSPSLSCGFEAVFSTAIVVGISPSHQQQLSWWNE